MFRTSAIKKYGDIIADVVNEDDQLLLRAMIEGERLILPEALFTIVYITIQCRQCIEITP